MNTLDSVTIGDYYTPQAKQAEFHNSPARYPLAEGGRGGGKTSRDSLRAEQLSKLLRVGDQLLL